MQLLLFSPYRCFSFRSESQTIQLGRLAPTRVFALVGRTVGSCILRIPSQDAASSPDICIGLPLHGIVQCNFLKLDS